MNKESVFVLGIWLGSLSGMIIAGSIMDGHVSRGLLITAAAIFLPLIGGCIHQSWQQRSIKEIQPIGGLRMGNYVVGVRSTNGGGKSTTVRKFLTNFNAEPILNEKGKVQDYVMKAQPGLDKDTYVLGPYLTDCGGCDAIKTQDEICDRIRKYAQLGNVLYEGLLVSGLFSRYNALADSMPEHKFIFAFLDTPLEKCIAQTLGRREAKGNTKPFDPLKTLEPKFRAIVASRQHLEDAGKDCRTLDHTRAYEVVVDWLKG
jgi:hypothetical protein